MSHRFLLALLLAAVTAPAAADNPPAPTPASQAGTQGSGSRATLGAWVHGARAWVSDLWSKDAGDWLDRIGPALVEQDYQGTLVIVSGTSMETMGVFHAYDDGRERMRLVTLTGPHREVIRNDRMVMCIGTGIDSVGYDADTAGRWNPAGQFAEAGKLDSYRARLGNVGRVAARDCQVVDLQPKDGWRYGYRLWLDHDTGLPLRIALIGDDGKALEQMAFTELQVGSKPDEANLRPSTQQGLRRVQTLSAGKQSDPGWRVTAPPAGFTLRGGRRLGESVQLLYSDGLASVSVYVEPFAGDQHGESAMRRGAVNVHSIWQGGRRVVAIGKVPAGTVDYFARNVHPSGATASARP